MKHGLSLTLGISFLMFSIGFGFRYLTAESKAIRPAVTKSGEEASTPELAIKFFLDEYGRANVAGMRRSLSFSVDSSKTDEFVKNKSFGWNLSQLQTRVTSIAGESAIVEVQYKIDTETSDDHTPIQETVICRRHEGIWKVVGGDRTIGNIAKVAGGNVAAMDTVIINLANVKAKSQAATCLSQGKRLGLSIIYYVEDHEEVYPPIQSWVQKTKSKWDSTDLITCPLDGEGYVSYSMNKLVAGQSVAEMYSPADTVLLYEGRDEKLSFKHDGKAVVVFADGHVRLITAEAAKNLIWTMDGSSVGEQR